MKIKFLPLFILLFLNGCTDKNSLPGNEEFNTYTLRELIIEAANGSKKANDSLSNFFNLDIPANKNFNELYIDSINTNSGKKFFLILLEHPNPVYNRFAVFDNKLNAYIIDKSLTGWLNQEVIGTDDLKFLKITETFKSKDLIELDRMSLYKITDDSVFLSFRSFTRLTEPRKEFFQKVVKINEDTILTQLSGNPGLSGSFKIKADTFIINSANIYLSSNELFDNFIKNEIFKFKHETEGLQIEDEAGAIESASIMFEYDTGFSITTNEDWRELKNVGIVEHVKQKSIGIKYINTKADAQFSIIKITPEDSAESYINYKLENSATGNYKVRYSDEIPSGKNYLQFFEFSCGSKKYLMIFEASSRPSRDQKNKKAYEDIINSFYMDC